MVANTKPQCITESFAGGLYGSKKLSVNKNAQVIVFGGTQAADKAQDLFQRSGIAIDRLATISWTGDINGVDWSLLAGRGVGLWPHAGEAGASAMLEVGRKLKCHVDGGKLKIFVLPLDVPEGWSLADKLPDGFELLEHIQVGHHKTLFSWFESHRCAAPEQPAVVEAPVAGSMASTTVKPAHVTVADTKTADDVELTSPRELAEQKAADAEDVPVADVGEQEAQDLAQTEAAPAKKRRNDGDVPVYSQKTPMKTARGMISRVWGKDGHRTIHRAGGSFFTWSGTHYIEAEDEAVRATIYHHLESARCLVRGKDGESGSGPVAPFNPDSASVSKVQDALCAVAQLPGGRPQECWLDGRSRPVAKEVISVANGLLHMPTRKLFPHSALFFTQNTLPFDYNPDAPEPVEWLRFLNGLWPGDPDSIGLLQRWMGYLLSASTGLQKMMLLIGPPRSGKGTIMRIMKSLLGDANVAGPRLSAFATQFGMEPLIGKRAAIVGDARLSGKIDQGEIVGSLLSITGEDTLTVDRKNRAAWSGVLPVRITICTNEMPRLQDASGALASRFLILQMEKSFLGQEDHGLGERIECELPGILKWALEGWDALQREGRFPEPAASKAAIGALGELSSPIRAFVSERCELDPAVSTPCQDLFDVWQAWCKQQGRDHPGNLQSFGRDLAAAVAGLKVSQPRNGGEPRRRVYEGIRLRSCDSRISYSLSFEWDENSLTFLPVVIEGSGFYHGANVSFEDHLRHSATVTTDATPSARHRPSSEDFSQPPI